MPKVHSYLQADIATCGSILILNVKMYVLFPDRLVPILFVVEHLYSPFFVIFDALFPNDVKSSFEFQITHFVPVQVSLMKIKIFHLSMFLQHGCGRNWFRSAVRHFFKKLPIEMVLSIFSELVIDWPNVTQI
jgi:hypothetical protein